MGKAGLQLKPAGRRQRQARSERAGCSLCGVKAAQQRPRMASRAAVDAAVKAAQQQAEDVKQAAVDAVVKAAQQQAEDSKQAAVDAVVKAAQQQAEDGKQAAVDAVVKAAQQQVDAAKKLWGMMRLREENKDAQFQQELTEMFNKLERKECIIRKHEASTNAIRERALGGDEVDLEDIAFRFAQVVNVENDEV
eukprot:gene29380-5731_t